MLLLQTKNQEAVPTRSLFYKLRNISIDQNKLLFLLSTYIYIFKSYSNP